MNRVFGRLNGPRSFCVLATLTMAMTAPSLVAQDKVNAAASLVKQLSDASFDVRRDARQKLFEMGQTAIPALKAAASDKSNDAGYSAVRILSRMMTERTGKDAEAARNALTELAKGKDAIARQARESLEEARPPSRRPQRMPNIGGFGGNPGINGFGGIGRSSQTVIVNGVRTTNIREPGRTIKITQDPNGPVSVTVTDEGKKPKTWEADNLDELKTKHPEGFKVYQTYGRGVRRLAVPGNIDDLLAMPPIAMDPFDGFPGGDPFGVFRLRRQAPKVDKELQDAELIMQDMAELLKSLKAKTNAPEVKRLESKLGALKRNMQRIEEQVR